MEVMLADLFATRNVAGAVRCLSNIQLIYCEAVVEAIETSGLRIEWRRTPDENMCPMHRHLYGSIWSAEADLTAFWTACRSVRDREDGQDSRRREP
jgi:hypothetical protein